MFAQLTFFPGRPEAPWRAEYFALPGVGAEVPEKLLRVRRLSATALAKTQTQLSAGEQSALGDRIFETIERVPDDLSAYSFGAHMAMAHFLLPPAERQRREAAIASLDAALLAPARLDTLNLWRSATLRMAVLVPDAALDAIYRSSVGHLFQYLRDQPDHDQHICRKTGWRNLEARYLGHPDLAKALASDFFTRRFGERQAFVDLLSPMAPAELAKLLAAVDQDLQTSGRELLIADRCEAHLGAMRAWQALPAEGRNADALTTVVALERERLAMRESARCTHIVAATLEALAKETAFGSDAGQKNREAIALCRRFQVRPSRPARSEAPSGPSLATTDLDPVHTWSIDRLVHWIDGPVAQPKLSLELERICAAEEQDWKAEQAQRTPSARLDGGPLKRHEVQMAVAQGLRASAQFLRDELRDLLPLGTQLQADANLLRACQDCLAALTTLALSQPADEAGDMAQAMADLQRADQALDALRRGIHQRQGEEQTRQRFTAALFQCLRNEPLTLGKRHGGVIAEPLPLEEWGWAVQTFHKRWWNAGLRPSATAAPMPLAPDQALALYVTGSSMSDYAFDISVHLWRRQAASGLPPTTPGEGNTMNEPDWYDTLIPCAVLHVRAKT